MLNVRGYIPKRGGKKGGGKREGGGERRGTRKQEILLQHTGSLPTPHPLANTRNVVDNSDVDLPPSGVVPEINTTRTNTSCGCDCRRY